jgi:hypothetical protein
LDYGKNFVLAPEETLFVVQPWSWCNCLDEKLYKTWFFLQGMYTHKVEEDTDVYLLLNGLVQLCKWFLVCSLSSLVLQLYTYIFMVEEVNFFEHLCWKYVIEMKVEDGLYLVVCFKSYLLSLIHFLSLSMDFFSHLNGNKLWDKLKEMTKPIMNVYDPGLIYNHLKIMRIIALVM